MFCNLDKNLKMCVIYNPPSNSRYYKPNLIEDIELDILDFCEDNSPILLIGDMNARTNKLNDYTEINQNNVSNFLIEQYHPKIERQNCDLQINQEGLKLIFLLI